MLWHTLAHVSRHVEPCKPSLAPRWLVMASLWCHTGAMDLGTYVSNIRQELALAADAGGDDARALAERLAPPPGAARRPAGVGPSPGPARRPVRRGGRDHP